MSPSDFDDVSRLRQELKQALEILGNARRQHSGAHSVPEGVAKKNLQHLSVRKTHIMRTSVGNLDEMDTASPMSSPLPSPKLFGRQQSLPVSTPSSARSSWLTRKSGVGPQTPTTSLGSSAEAHPLMFAQEVDMTSIAARFYHTACYDRPNQRILIHGGLRRDKPSRLCLSQVFAMDFSESRKPTELKWVWQVMMNKKK